MHEFIYLFIWWRTNWNKTTGTLKLISYMYFAILEVCGGALIWVKYTFFKVKHYFSSLVSTFLLLSVSNSWRHSNFWVWREFEILVQSFSSLQITECDLNQQNWHIEPTLTSLFVLLGDMWKALRVFQNLDICPELIFWCLNCTRLSVPTILQKLEGP